MKQAGITLLDCDHKTPAAKETGRPYVGIPQMTTGRVDFSTARRISEEDFVTWTRKTKYQKNDIILSRRTNPGVTAVDDTDTDFALGQNLVLLRADGKRVFPPFLRWLVRTPEWWEEIDKFINVGAVFSSLRCGDVPKFELTIPPLTEQISINRVLRPFDNKIELNQRLNETLEALAQAIFKDWFVDFGPVRRKQEGVTDPVAILGGLIHDPVRAAEVAALFSDSFGDDGLPEGWGEESLLDIADWVNGAAYKNMHFVPADADGLPVIKIAELKAGITDKTKFTNTDLGEKYRISDGELLFSWSGNPDTSIDAFVWSGGNAWLNQHIFAVRTNGKRSKPFLFTILKFLMPEFAELARNKQTTGLGHVTKSDMGRIQVPVTPQLLTQTFSELIDPIYDRMVLSLNENRTLAETRDYLLPKLMSGKVRICDAEKVVE